MVRDVGVFFSFGGGGGGGGGGVGNICKKKKKNEDVSICLDMNMVQIVCENSSKTD